MNVYLLLKGLRLLKTKLRLLSYKISRSVCPLEMVNGLFLHAVGTLLCFLHVICHLSLVEILSEHCVCVWFVNTKLCLDKRRSFQEVATKVLHDYTFSFLLSSCQWDIIFKSIFSNGYLLIEIKNILLIWKC